LPTWTSFVARLCDVVTRLPEHPAIAVDGIPAATYCELWQLSERAAHGLRQSGVAPGAVVGLGLDKSVEFIAAMIGLWRLRAAYVPLDLQAPPDRRSWILKESGATLAIIRQANSLRLPITTVSWDDLISHEAPADIDFIQPAPGDLAWVISTSGTTGQPRCVAVPQRGFVTLLDAQRQAFQLDSSSRSLAFYSVAFDAFLSDAGTALLSGACLCLENPETLRSSLLDVLTARRITHADLPPSLLATLDPEQAPDSLRSIIIGGEVCPPDVVRRWAARRRVINVYGPTEATVCTSLCLCDPQTWSRPLLGQPIADVEYLVVDENEHPVTPGGTGELWIGGPCLALGYLNQPELTTTRFPRLEGRRYYRTGDRVRLDPDGEYVFLGRMDRQIKLRGLRIELEEIEAVLTSHPGIRRAAVVLRKQTPTARREQLVAFVECDGSVLPDQVHSHLRRLLPPWMIPARIEFRTPLPTTASSKLDLESLRTLPLNTLKASVERPEGVSPQTATLLRIARTLLGVEQFGVDDDFFEHGGDSLAVFEFIGSAKQHGIAISPSALIRDRSIRRLCSRVEDATSDVLSAAWLLNNIEPEVQALQHGRSTRAQDGRATESLTIIETPLVLLTGATGFLGSHVLQQWLEQTSHFVICLVRASDDVIAEQRLSAALHFHKIELPVPHRSRVRAVAGDLARPQFGWSNDQCAKLSQSVITVIHCGARVNLINDFQTLRLDTISGTFHVLEFLTAHRRKSLCYVSTLSVFVGTDRRSGELREDDDLSHTREVYGGYAQTKWAAEMLVRRCGLPGSDVQIFRLGLLTGDCRTAIIPERDLFAMTIRALVRLGCVPDVTDDLAMDVTPVDFAAAAMVSLFLHQTQAGSSVPQTWHLANPQSISAKSLFQSLYDICPNMERVTPHEFLRRVHERDDPETSAASTGLARGLQAQSQAPPIVDLFQATGVQLGTGSTIRAWEALGLHCPAPDSILIQRYLRQILNLPKVD
jgi:amino acid adenylation domain-containing protein/thioester reductase-like protein